MMNGKLAGHVKEPQAIARCDTLARPGYSDMPATEYMDSADALDAKITILASLMRESSHTVIFSGAGISTSAGVGDYATKAARSRAPRENKSLNRLRAAPTRAHCAIASIERSSVGIASWIDQNHDALPLKAGFPMSKLNQIHGSFFDRRNRVVMMDESLRPDLYERLVADASACDLTVAIGTSLAGMTAEKVCVDVAARARSGLAKGLVIIGLQRTPMEERAALCIYALADDAMAALAKKLRVRIKSMHLEQPEWR